VRKCNELGKYARHQWIFMHVPLSQGFAWDKKSISITQLEVIPYIEIFQEARQQCGRLKLHWL